MDAYSILNDFSKFAEIETSDEMDMMLDILNKLIKARYGLAQRSDGDTVSYKPVNGDEWYNNAYVSADCKYYNNSFYICLKLSTDDLTTGSVMYTEYKNVWLIKDLNHMYEIIESTLGYEPLEANFIDPCDVKVVEDAIDTFNKCIPAIKFILGDSEED